MPSESDSLVAILADMLRSALTWEEKNALSSSQTEFRDLSDAQTAQRISAIPKKGGKDCGNAEESTRPPK